MKPWATHCQLPYARAAVFEQRTGPLTETTKMRRAGASLGGHARARLQQQVHCGAGSVRRAPLPPGPVLQQRGAGCARSVRGVVCQNVDRQAARPKGWRALRCGSEGNGEAFAEPVVLQFTMAWLCARRFV